MRQRLLRGRWGWRGRALGALAALVIVAVPPAARVSTAYTSGAGCTPGGPVPRLATLRGPAARSGSRVLYHGVALDQQRGLTVVVGSPPDDATTPGFLDVFDTTSGRLLRSTPIGAGAQALAVDSRRGRIVVAEAPGERGQVEVLDEASLRVLRRLAVGKQPVVPLLDEGLGHALVATVWPSDVHLLDTASGRELRVTHVSGVALVVPERAAVGLDGRTHRYFTGDNSGPIAMLDTASGRLLGTVQAVYPRLFGVDERLGRVFVTDEWGLRVLDARSGAVKGWVGLDARVFDIAVDERRHHAVVNLSTDFRTVAHVGAFDTLTLRATPPAPLGPPAGNPPVTIDAVDEQRGRVYAGVAAARADDGTPQAGTSYVAVLDSTSGAVLRRFNAGTGQPVTLAVDAARGRAVIGDDRGGSLFDVSCF